MARGWESKSVEEQIEATLEAKNSSGAGSSKKQVKPVSKTTRPSQQRESLLLARTRILRDIQTTENARYRQLLETTLEAVEKQLLEIK
ncbi:MAG: hypothetical protein DMG05_09475 [Acidobacteria bacterium]|nr:MAG: hypothetical protein DMG05_09475 [Acidobacteriota bacterium]